MQIVFDRYLPRGGARHLDLATGRLVTIAVLDVLSDDWRRRWHARVDALLAPCDGLEPLIDAGASGPHAVFEVRAEVPGLRMVHRMRVPPARHAVAWLRAHELSAGACRAARLLADGRLCADRQTGWPIETREENAAARRQWRAWERLMGPLPDASESRTAMQPVRSNHEVDEEFDTRAGLVELRVPQDAACRYARRTGRVAVSGAFPSSAIDAEIRAQRSFLLLDTDREAAASWAALLAAAGSRRHFYVAPQARAGLLRERARAYGAVSDPDIASRSAPVIESPAGQAMLARARRHLARRELADATRTAGRAALVAGALTSAHADAILLKAQALRYGGHARGASALLERELRDNAAAASAAMLTEAAEAACDNAQLQQAEAFARAAVLAARNAAAQARARLALDRARLWAGEHVEGEFWQSRAAWHEWGAAPRWPSRGRYPHAPCGRLARWESLCDRLEQAIWHHDEATAARLRKRLAGSPGELPLLLQARTKWLVEGDGALARRMGARGVLQTGKAGVVMEIFEHMSALLSACHESRSDEAALSAAAARTRRVLRARAVAVYTAAQPLPVAGDGDRWSAPSALASRCTVVAQTAGPERVGALCCVAASIRGAEGPAGALLAIWSAGDEIESRRVRLLLEAAALVMAPALRGWCARVEAPMSSDMPEIVGVSPAIHAVRDAVRRVSQVPFAVVIEGESGAGKELVARAIHRLSPRAARPFRALNCAAMSEELVEAELFGHAQGAYTGATTARAGLFEDADRGTLFLDEVSELSPRAQAKLLRVLQEGEVRRVGETSPRRVDVRIVAASNRPLRTAVAAQAFRADLLFRLDVLRVEVPPLRARPEDIPLLCAHFWRQAADRAGTSAQVSPEAVGRLAAYSWPGNVRELQNVIAAMAVSAPRRGRAGIEHLPPHIRSEVVARPTLHQARATLERDLVRNALARAGGKPGRAAAELGVSRQGLAKLMRRLGLPAA